MVSVDDLAGVPLFDTLDADQLANIARWFHEQNAGAGRKLVGEGAPGYTFFVLVKWTAQVSSEGEAQGDLVAGDFFGEMAILGAGRRTATVTSTSPVRLLVMFGSEFRQLEAALPEIASRLTDAMQTRANRFAELA